MSNPDNQPNDHFVNIEPRTMDEAEIRELLESCRRLAMPWSKRCLQPGDPFPADSDVISADEVRQILANVEEYHRMAPILEEAERQAPREARRGTYHSREADQPTVIDDRQCQTD